MSPLPKDDQRTLLLLARRAIVEAVSHLQVFEVPAVTDNLAKPTGAFVTLYCDGHLRGCIGRIEPTEPLARTIAQCAVGAALHDPRFTPVVGEELARLTIEISVLSPVEPILPEAVKVGTHGLVVQREHFRGVLLPRVAVERAWTRERFLEETCRKAGLPPDPCRHPPPQRLPFTDHAFSPPDFKQHPPASA